jgi:pullulanase/glycogen debranching enzyme
MGISAENKGTKAHWNLIFDEFRTHFGIKKPQLEMIHIARHVSQLRKAKAGNVVEPYFYQNTNTDKEKAWALYIKNTTTGGVPAVAVGGEKKTEEKKVEETKVEEKKVEKKVEEKKKQEEKKVEERKVEKKPVEKKTEEKKVEKNEKVEKVEKIEKIAKKKPEKEKIINEEIVPPAVVEEPVKKPAVPTRRSARHQP